MLSRLRNRRRCCRCHRHRRRRRRCRRHHRCVVVPVRDRRRRQGLRHETKTKTERHAFSFSPPTRNTLSSFLLGTHVRAHALKYETRDAYLHAYRQGAAHARLRVRARGRGVHTNGRTSTCVRVSPLSLVVAGAFVWMREYY